MTNKGGITVVPNKRNEIVLMCLVTGLSVYIDYQILNAWTKNDHFPMSFMDQTLDWLTGNI